MTTVTPGAPVPSSRTGSARRVRARGLLGVVAVATGLALALTGAGRAPADAETPGSPDADGRVLTTVSLDGGAVLMTTAEFGPLALGDCPANKTCIWTGAGYTGTMYQYSSPGSLIVLPAVTIASYANNRSYIATFYATSSGGGASACARPQSRNSAVAGWLLSADSLLQSSSVTSC